MLFVSQFIAIYHHTEPFMILLFGGIQFGSLVGAIGCSSVNIQITWIDNNY